ncbi:hypothetical protein [Streptomyces sp. NPDC057554]|uniref:hypothetical protein n=1 Tax=Streptomyces sp. NPDC057554 TaxID=3350538 RepID=UPI003678CBE8
MSVGGAGIPRLQELAYIELAACAVAEGLPFDRIRRVLVAHAARVAGENGIHGAASANESPDSPTELRHVHNTVDALKELMRLGWVERHILPSTRKSAYAHAHITFQLTAAGKEWTQLVTEDPHHGYNHLVGVLVAAHPQFKGFLRVVGARPDSTSDHFTIPLMPLSERTGINKEKYLSEFINYAAGAVSDGALGWSTSREALTEGVTEYVMRINRRIVARKGTMSFKRLTNTCEEALVRLAFDAAGCRLDYISHELLRRWTRYLGLANFSYYAPGPPALRFWATGSVAGEGAVTALSRKAGHAVREAALATLPDIWREQRGDPRGDMYLPIWRIRAALCWRQRISDDEFDTAIIDCHRGRFPHLGFRIHLDGTKPQQTPASTRPLVVTPRHGTPQIQHIMRVYPARIMEEAGPA